MTWLFPHIWLWVLTSTLLGFAITLYATIGGSSRPKTPRASRATRRNRADAPTSDEPVGERTRHRAAIADQASPEGPAGSAAAAGSGARRRRRYEVEDVEVEEWGPGQVFPVEPSVPLRDAAARGSAPTSGTASGSTSEIAPDTATGTDQR